MLIWRTHNFNQYIHPTRLFSEGFSYQIHILNSFKFLFSIIQTYNFKTLSIFISIFNTLFSNFIILVFNSLTSKFQNSSIMILSFFIFNPRISIFNNSKRQTWSVLSLIYSYFQKPQIQVSKLNVLISNFNILISNSQIPVLNNPNPKISNSTVLIPIMKLQNWSILISNGKFQISKT